MNAEDAEKTADERQDKKVGREVETKKTRAFAPVFVLSHP